MRPKTDSVERTLDVVGDRWSFLILREAFFGVRRFDEFRQNTGVAPNILTARLKKLVDHGVFRRARYSGHANRYEYRLTDKGLDLYPMIVLMMRWGDKWLSGPEGPPLTLIHKPCGHVLDAPLRCDACGAAVDAHDMDWKAN